MKVLIAPDKFKGTLSATEAAQAMAAAVTRYNPQWQAVLLPIADGGEGTAEVLTHASGGAMISVRAADPLMRSVGCSMGISADGTTAFIDISAASGMRLLDPSEANPLQTSTLGTGQMITSALMRRCKRIVLGLGGSATMDCGMGIAHALGAVFMGENRIRTSPIAANLKKVEFLDLDHVRPELKRTEILLLHDVDVPLLGEDGAMRFAAQKGLPESEFKRVHEGLTHFANLIEAKTGVMAKTPGMGAAGGAALCCVALLKARLAPGAAYVLEALGAAQAVADADLVLTGEGRLDAQSLAGKAPVALARLAQAQGKHVAAVCGQIALDERALREAGIDQAAALMPDGADPRELRGRAAEHLTAQTLELLRAMAPKLQLG